MSSSVSRRSALLLFLALSLAVGCGLAALPALDPLASLRGHDAPMGLVTALLHLSTAWLATAACRQCLAQRVHP
uniref:hypothetical protein n=1 Tax=Ideonella azotifigens TaxID=513160 RepID=UPI0011430E64